VSTAKLCRWFASGWIYDCDPRRPNVALGGFTPKQRLAMAA